MMHQQSMMVGDIPVNSDIPVHVEDMINVKPVGYDTGNSGSHAYDDLFPALPHSAPPVQRNIQQATNKLRVGSTLHTQVRTIHVHVDDELCNVRYITCNSDYYAFGLVLPHSALLHWCNATLQVPISLLS